jgi:hypothetical protein
MKSLSANRRVRSSNKHGAANPALAALVPLMLALAPLTMMVWVIAETTRFA